MKVSTRAVHLVDENHARHFVFVGLPPYRFGLGLDAGGTAKNDYCPIEHPQGALYLNSKVHMAWRIDNVNTVIFKLGIHTLPETGCSGRGNSYPPLLLLFHPVHSGSAIMHFAYLVGQTGIEEHAFSRSRLARINVGTDANITISTDGCFTRHVLIPDKVKGRQSEAVVRERLIRFRHTMNIFALLNRITLALRRIDNFPGEALTHRFFTAVTCVLH